MKQFFTIIITVCYLVTSSGFTLDLHYCMGELVSIGIGEGEKQKCPKCGMDEKKGCCENKHYKLQLDKDQKSVSISSDQPRPNKLTPVFLVSCTSFQLSQVFHPDFVPASPPGKAKLDVFLLNSVFRI